MKVKSYTQHPHEFGECSDVALAFRLCVSQRHLASQNDAQARGKAMETRAAMTVDQF
jgi:hypothetical protein